MTKPRNLLLKRSTEEFFQEGENAGDYSQFDKFHGYLYSKWPYLYISVALGEHRLNKILAPFFLYLSSLFGDKDGEADPEYAWANSYHGKVVPLEEAKNLVRVEEDIDIRNLEHVIPFTKARDIVMINPDRIVVMDCPCRVSREDPCTPVDVCLIVGDPFASFILEHQPEKTRLITTEEAMEILKQEHERGHVSHAFFKDAMLNRFYAICNCCSCCCGAFQSHKNGTPMLLSSGYIASVNSDLCESCGICEGFCQFSAIDLMDGMAVIHQEACFGCGVCVDKCEQAAIQLNLDPTKGEPLEILTLMEEARRSV
jgi:NAD-dependent dihydropyrimidine dehydrogenase PreA subunit